MGGGSKKSLTARDCIDARAPCDCHPIAAGSRAAGLALLGLGDREFGPDAGVLFAWQPVFGAQCLETQAQRRLGCALAAETPSLWVGFRERSRSISARSADWV
jgi:hypothetical protein